MVASSSCRKKPGTEVYSIDLPAASGQAASATGTLANTVGNENIFMVAKGALEAILVSDSEDG